MWQAMIAVSIAASSAFPSDPIEGELKRGAEIQKKGKGIDRAYLEDRVIIGSWFSGRKREDIEEVIRLSPELISRWLGYLKARERWNDDELQRRWDFLADAMGNETHYIVRLSAFPKISILDIDPAISNDATTEEITNIRFAIETSEGTKEPKSLLLEHWQNKEWQPLGDFKWYLSLPYGEALRPEFESREDGWSYPTGPYYSSWYLLRMPVSEVPAWVPQSLLVFSKSKTRTAKFNQPRMK